jgi:putative methyltransferase (TIGR04325 family)
MKKALKSFAIDWFPPAFVRWFHRRRGGGICFEGNYATWEAASVRCSGYDSEGILARVLESTLKVKHGEAVFERDSVLFDKVEYAWPVLAGLMLASARNDGKLNVLDFGGALGSGYFQNRKFFQMQQETIWNVVEQGHYVEAGQASIQDERLHFYKTIEDCLTKNQPNVVLLSSVLQYISDPYGLLHRLIDVQPDIFILDRTCYSNYENNEVIRIQHVPASIYSASYPCRYFDENVVLKCFNDGGYRLLEDFDSLDKLDTMATWKGHIFIRKSHGC